MSRRESRSSLGARQTNALEEFENFKKKYLLVNKHIAKLNSSLNVRIEELLSQIAVLNNDNLRLRASELSLARKLANEQDRSRRLYREIESASHLLMDQVSSMKIMFGLDRPANPVTVKTVVAPRQKPVRPSLPAVNRLARAPEFDIINEVIEEDQTPSKQSPRRDSAYPSPTASTPTRRRSTGSTGTPRSTPSSNSSTSPEDRTPARSSGEPRKSTPPISMEISNDSSPLSSSPSVSITNQLTPISPSPVISAKKQASLTSPPTVDNTVIGEKEAAENGKPQGTSAAPSSLGMPHLNLFGLKRVSRRPSGLLMCEPPGSKNNDESSAKITQPSVSVSIPSADISIANSGSAAYPTPLSPNPAPRTPPRQPITLGLSESDAPITPTRKLPMSPVLTANPALSPPPAKKLSLTRRQLDFGIPESEQGNKENEDDDDGRNSDDEFLGFQNDARAGRRALKRKALEDEEDEAIVAKVDKEPAIRGKRQEKRRDTGTVLTGLSLKEKGSKGSLIGEGMENKESLRDVTNERSSAPTQTQDIKQVKPTSNTVMERSNISEARAESRVHASVGLTARIQRLESRAQAPLVSPIPLPPQEETPVAVEETNEQPSEFVEATNNMDLGRRGSGRARKSVNYREPSLVTKMRKPDPTPPPPTPLSSARSGGEVLSSITYRPPKRKKGSISLVDDMIGSGTSSASVTPSGSSESGKKTSEGDRVRSLTEGLLRTKRAARDVDLDLSSSDEDFQTDAERQSRLAGGAGEGSTTSKSSSKSSKGFSILSKGPNPIISPSSTGYSLFPALNMPTQSSGARTRDPFITSSGLAQVADEAMTNGREGTDGVAT